MTVYSDQYLRGVKDVLDQAFVFDNYDSGQGVYEPSVHEYIVPAGLQKALDEMEEKRKEQEAIHDAKTLLRSKGYTVESP